MNHIDRHIRSMADHFVSMWDSMEDDIRLSCAPESGHFVTYETKAVHWNREVTEKGDIIYRRMTPDEVSVWESNDEVEGNK